MATNLSKAHFKILGTNEPVPAGYICLGERWPAKTPTARDRERIRRGIADKHIDAYRRMRFVGDDDGPIYVCETDAVRWLISYQNSDADSPKPQHNTRGTQCRDGQWEAALVSLTRIDNGLALIHETLERLANAVEAIATQPQKHDFAEFTQN
jgi:hypothetical protein